MCVEHRVPAAAGKVHRRPYRCVCVCSLCMTWCDGVSMCMRDLCVYVYSPGVASDLCFSPNNNMLMISVGMDAVIRCYDIQQRKYARYKLSFCLLEFHQGVSFQDPDASVSPSRPGCCHHAARWHHAPRWGSRWYV